MRVRHRIPSIFNLSMVDVLCCALGCVILLWLLNLRQAKQYEEETGEQTRQSAALLATAEADREAARRTIRDLEGRLAALEDDLRAGTKRTEAQLARAEELAKKLDAAEGRIKGLQVSADAVPGLRADLKTARDETAKEAVRVKGLEKEIAERTKELSAAKKALDESLAAKRSLEKDLDDSLAAKRSLEKDLDGRDKALTEARSFKDKLSLAEERVLTLNRQLTDANRSLDALKAETGRLRAAADSRFAGIALTGRRVVFLVDMSGSMHYIDEKTPSPDKWNEVRRTLTKVMRSLPDLEKFQVIVFSDKASFLLGQEGKWLDYDGADAAERVAKALAKVKPDGGTNMYAALDAAFRYRASGLDTVYLFSDGLPNLGAGLKPEEAKKLKDTEISEILGKHILKTLKNDWNREGRNQPRVRINAIGFFYESPDVGAFLWALARENDGSFVGMSRP
jgi:hypothetical protein